MHITIPLPRVAAEVWPTLTEEQRQAVIDDCQDAVDRACGVVLGASS